MKKIAIENMPSHIQTNSVPYIVAQKNNKLIDFTDKRTKSNLIDFINNL